MVNVLIFPYTLDIFVASIESAEFSKLMKVPGSPMIITESNVTNPLIDLTDLSFIKVTLLDKATKVTVVSLSETTICPN
jgi:hypothetical protein